MCIGTQNYEKNKISKWSKLIYAVYEMEIEDRLKFEDGVKRASRLMKILI